MTKPGSMFDAVLPFAIALFPLLSVGLGVMFLEKPPSSPPDVTNKVSEVNISLSHLAALLVIVGVKLAAVIGIWRRVYFSWLFHALELSVVCFFLGLIIVVAIFSLPFNIFGLAKLVLLFFALACCLALKKSSSEIAVRNIMLTV